MSNLIDNSKSQIRLSAKLFSATEFAGFLVDNGYDNSRCNMLAGRTFDKINDNITGELKPGDFYIAVKDHNDRFIVGSNCYDGFMSIASHVALPKEMMTSALRYLACYLIEELLVPYQSIQSIHGPASYVEYLQGQLLYFAKIRDMNVVPRIPDPEPLPPVHLGVLATDDELSRSAHCPTEHRIETLEAYISSLRTSETAGVISKVERLLAEFYSDRPEISASAAQKARDVVSTYIEGNQQNSFFLCLLSSSLDTAPHVAGILVMGRETRRTIAIRHVFVSPQHRRQGIAEHLVRHACAHWLQISKKEEVCLLVEVGSDARRVYQKVGFRWDWVGWEGDDPEKGIQWVIR
ncbi:hypothetical protein BT69DRAFT_1346342 [Atractiella rhizophila]|nr:hypothetical protein BT69DRAFT_1346342 [Atractiella rhizophila]